MTFADFLINVPSSLRLLLAVVITAGISVVLVRRFHSRILKLGGWPLPAYDDPSGRDLPTINDLVGRILALTMFAFVFLLAFTLSNFWGAEHAARDATNAQSMDFSRAWYEASLLPLGEGRAEILKGLTDYRTAVDNDVDPALRQADVEQAYALQRQATTALESGVQAAYQLGASKSPVWSQLTDNIASIADDGENRILALPTGNIARAALILVMFLGLMNLALTSIYVPAPLSANLVLIGIMAAITAVLLFVVVEAANPYIGSAAVLDTLTLSGG
ncbi:MAG: hypothetical protein NTX29_00125 [Actinobacteria bacterium]|nr:hypothetical protein [Actinomycetota bacterium]